MKKIYLTLIALVFAINFSYAQWTAGAIANSITNTNSGNVGIGTSNPVSKLYLSAGARNGLMIDGSLDGTPTGKYLSIWQGSGGIGIDPIGTGLIYLGYDQASDIYFGHTPSSGANGFWKADGNVGIGTTSSSGLLTIGSSSNRGTVNLIGSSDNPPALSITDSRSGSHQYTIYNGVSGIGNLDIYDQVASAYRFTINSSGNIGIGTASPIKKLEVLSSTAGVAGFGTSSIGNTSNIVISNGSNYNYGVMGVVSGTGSPTGDSYGLGYDSNPNTSFTPVLNWTSGGNVGIGTTNPDQKLTVKGTIHSQEVIVDMNSLPDYVFTLTYHLPTLNEVKTYIDQNHHLPEMPSAEQVAKDGLSLGEMNAKLLKKVEELTLYLIEKDKQLKDQQAINKLQGSRLDSQQEQINQLKEQMATLTKTLTKN